MSARLIRARDVCARTGLARSTLYDLVRRDEFPAPIPLTERTVAWIEAEVVEWIAGKTAPKTAPPTDFDPHALAKTIHGKPLLSSDRIAAKAQPWEPKCGIYFLLLQGDVQYVGQSTNVEARITNHRNTGKSFDAWHWEPCAREDLDTREALYIHALRPRLNLYDSGKYAGDVCVPVGLAQLLALAEDAR